MEFSAKQIAELLDAEIDGNPEVLVTTLSKIEEGKEGTLSFLGNPKYEQYLYTTKSSIVIVNQDIKLKDEVNTTLLKVDNAHKAFAKLLDLYNQFKNNKIGIETPSFISEKVKFGNDCFVGRFAYISDNVIIGDNVKIHPNVFIGENTIIEDNSIIFSGTQIYAESKIGKNVIIHSNSVIGADGFGFAPNEKGEFTKVPQIGNVIIEDNVEIGACSTIDRATLGSTIIRKGVKLDNHVQIAHNVEIGKNTVIAAQTGIAGSTKIGENCLIGGQVGIVGHITIGNNVKIQAQSGIGRNIKDNQAVQGSPAFNYSDFSKSFVVFKNLPELSKQINKLQKQIND